MSRYTIPLNPFTRTKALGWVEKAARADGGMVLEIRDAKRTDDQNSAMWSILSQIQKQRPMHNGVQMDTETWKALFLHALGKEMRFVPTLDGSSMLPLGLRSSKLTKAEFSELIEFMLAWAATEGLTIEHFDAANDTTARAA